MAERLSLEECLASVRNLGIHIVRMFVGVTRECRKRLEFTDRVNPRTHRRSAPGPPALDAEGAVRGPQKERGDRHEELIAPHVEQLDQAFESQYQP